MKDKDTDWTGTNLDRLADLLTQQLEDSTLGDQIPTGAHIFHGTYDDMALTQENLQLASRILLGMTLGYVDDAPLVMVYEHRPGQQMVVDLSEELQKDRALMFVEEFQEQNQQEMNVKIRKALAM